MQNTEEREFVSKLKKNYSIIQNALKRAQLDEGMMGDNEAIFMTKETSDTGVSGSELNYRTAKKLAKYLNVMKVCQKQTNNCQDYYNIRYANVDKTFGDIEFKSLLVLNDGTLMFIGQNEKCYEEIDTFARDEYNELIKDPITGENIETVWKRDYCAHVIVDVNGMKKPNRFGRDAYILYIKKNKITLPYTETYGDSKHAQNLFN